MQFAQAVESMPHIGDIKCDFDLRVEFASGTSNGTHYKFALYMDSAGW